MQQRRNKSKAIAITAKMQAEARFRLSLLAGSTLLLSLLLLGSGRLIGP